MKYKKFSIGSLMLLAFSFAAFGQLTILSGSKQATQFRSVEDMVNIVGPSLDFEIINKETTGAAFNTEQLMDPKSPYKIAILQADYLYFMQTSDMRNNTEKTKSLKVLLPLSNQQIHLVTKASRGFKSLKDMDKQDVSIGSDDQGTYRTAMLIKDRSKVNWVSLNTTFEACFGALNLNKIDAFFIVSSAPVEKLSVNPESMVDKLALVPLTNFNDWAKYYKPDTIYKSDYKWLDNDIPTFSVPAVLVVNESKLTEQDRKDVMKLKEALLSKSEELKKSGHPQWKETNFSDWKETDWPIFK